MTKAFDLGEEDTGDPTEEALEMGATDTDGLTISLPLDGFNPDSLDRLQKAQCRISGDGNSEIPIGA